MDISHSLPSLRLLFIDRKYDSFKLISRTLMIDFTEVFAFFTVASPGRENWGGQIEQKRR